MSSVQKRLTRFNASIICLLSKTTEQDPAADLTSVLAKITETYAKARKRIAKHDLETELQGGSSVSHLCIHRVNCGVIVETQLSHSSFATRTITRASGSATIVSPLSDSVVALLGDLTVLAPRTQSFPNFPQVLISGKTLWEGLFRIVIQLSDGVVVKIGQNLDHGEPELLAFVAQHAPCVPIPKALGSIEIDGMTYLFMSYVQGVTLEKCWPRLTTDQKASVRTQLNRMISEVRRVAFVPGTPLGSISGLRLCLDSRMTKRTSPKPLLTESDFNDFLTSCPFKRVSVGFVRWIRSLMRDDHRIVLTHGDFHPRNIMIVENQRRDAIVTGIIDWETGGWYPEHWEMVKAFNTRGIDDDSDWWDFLPEAICGYDTEVVLDRFLENFIRTI
jgi:hypothetical protein